MNFPPRERESKVRKQHLPPVGITREYNQFEMKHYYEDKTKSIRRIETINNLI